MFEVGVSCIEMAYGYACKTTFFHRNRSGYYDYNSWAVNYYFEENEMSAIRFLFILLISQIGEVANFLPSLNYWDLSSKLATDSSMQKRLGVSKDQVNAILEMRKQARIDELVEKEEERQLLQGQASPISNVELLSSLDSVIVGKLRLILNDFQIDQLRRIELQQRHKRAHEIFQSQEMIVFLRLSADDVKQLRISLKRAKSKFDAERAALLDEAAMEIIRVLPSNSKELFTQYAGNSYTPEIELRNDIELKSIPYIDEFRSIMSVRSLLTNVDLQARHSITPRQAEQLLEASRKFNENAFGPKPQHDNNFAKSLQESIADMERILNNSQLLSIYRRFAMSEFNANFCTPFERDDFLTYVEITTPSDIAAIRKIATAVTKEFQSNEKKLNERIFGEICTSLPQEAQRRLQLVFEGVWK